jgi:hypothetical protein
VRGSAFVEADAVLAGSPWASLTLEGLVVDTGARPWG